MRRWGARSRGGNFPKIRLIERLLLFDEYEAEGRPVCNQDQNGEHQAHEGEWGGGELDEGPIESHGGDKQIHAHGGRAVADGQIG